MNENPEWESTMRWFGTLWIGALFVLGNALVAQAIPDMNSSQGYYYDNFDSTQGVGVSSRVEINTGWHGVTLTAGQTSGWCISTTITPASLQGWLTLEADLAQPAGTALTFDVLDSQFAVLQSGLGTTITARHTEIFDISGLGLSQTALILRANFSGLPGSGPVLFSWRLRWVPKPNMLFQLKASSEADPQGGTVVAGTQLHYTLTYDINNVNVQNVVVSTTLTAKDGYGTEMINYTAGSASRSPDSPSGSRFMYWNLGNLTAGTNGFISFSVDVPDGTTCSWNTATHIAGRPITITAKLQSQETGFAGIISSPAGNTLVGSGGVPTVTFVQSAPRDGFGLVRPLYAIPGRPYTYVYRVLNLNGACGNPSTQSEIMNNILLTHQIPAGATYVTSGLYNAYHSGDGPVTSAEIPAGSGTVTWNVGKLLLHSSCACTFGQAMYLYITITIPAGWTPGTTFTIPGATVCSDQSATRTAAAAAVTLVAESTVDANPNSYVSFALDGWAATVSPCDTIYPHRYIMNQVNKPLQGAYIVEPVPDGATLQYWNQYCYPGTINGTISPRGNSVPGYYSTTVTAQNLPDPPNLASGIWRSTDTAKNFGRITHTLVNLGNLNYTLVTGSHDGMYRMYYTITGSAGNTMSMAAYFYPNTGTANAQRLASNTAQLKITDVFSPSGYYNSLVNSPDPIEAGSSTKITGTVFGHANNAFVYMIFPPELEYDPSGTTLSSTLRKNNCAGDHAVWIEYTTTPGVYPFNRDSAEHAAWTRVQPLDTTRITGVRWVLGDWWYYWGGGPAFSYTLSVRGKLGLPNNTVAVMRGYITYDGLGSSPVPTGSVTVNIQSHVQLTISKSIDKSLLPSGQIRYLLNYSNIGNMHETSAELWDKIPANTEFAGTQAPAGSTIFYSSNPSAVVPSSPADWSSNSFGASTTWVKWQVPGVSAQQLQAVTLTVKPKADILFGTVISNTAAMVAAHSTTLTSNTVTILNAPDFSDPASSNLNVDPAGDVKAGTVLRYSLNYYNTGLTGAKDVVIEDELDPSLDAATLRFLAGPKASYDAGTRTIRWEAGDLGSGMGGACLFTVAVIAGAVPAGEVTNTARIKSAETPWVNTNTVSNQLLTQIQNAQVEVEPKLESLNAEYRVKFRLGAGGGLSAGDTVILEFPVEMKLPGLIEFGKITVNGFGTQATSMVSGQRLTIPVPYPIGSDSEVEIAIRAEAGLKNPARGNYTLKISSSREGIWVTSGVYLITMFLGDEDVVAAPNPAQGEKVKFFYNMQEAGETEVDVYNVLGERVAQIVESKSAEKGASSTWHMGRVGSGVYLARIRLRYGGGRVVKLAPKKVIVIHE